MGRRNRKKIQKMSRRNRNRNKKIREKIEKYRRN